MTKAIELRYKIKRFHGKGKARVTSATYVVFVYSRRPLPGELEHRPQLLKTQSMDSKALLRLGTEQADPRLLSRRDSEKHRDSAATTAVPANRSESSTPRVAMTPVSAEMMPLGVSADAKPLAKMLQQFSHGIVSTTFQTNKSDSAKRIQHKSRKEDQKWRNRYDTFAPLAEVQQRNLDSSEKKSTRSDNKLQEIKRSHRANTGQIATSLALGGVTVPSVGPNADDKSKRDIKNLRAELDRVVSSFDKTRSDTTRIRAELEKTKADLERTTTSLNHTKSNLGQAEFVASKQSRMQKDFDEYRKDLSERHGNVEDRLLSMSNAQGRLEKQVAKVEANTVSMSTIRAMETNAANFAVNANKAEKMVKQYDTLTKRMRELDEQMQGHQLDVTQARNDLGAHSVQLQRLQSDYGNQTSQLAELKMVVDQKVADLRDLREVVSGDDIDDSKNGLLDMITSAQKDGGKFRNALELFNETINEFEEDIKQMKTKALSFEEAKARLEVRVDTLEDKRPPDTHTQDDMTGIREGLSALSSVVEKFEGDQEEKDDLVAREVERLDNELINQADMIKVLTDKINTLSSRPSSMPSFQQPSNPPSGNMSPPHLANGTLAKKVMDSQVVEELEKKHNMIKQEFDGLQSSFQQFKTSTTDVTNTHDTFITSLQQRFDNLTTDHMVKCMIHQMQILYPQLPGNILNQMGSIQKQIGQLIGNQQHFDQSLSRIQAQVNAVEELVKTNQQHVVPLIQTRCDKVESLMTERLDTEARERLQIRETLHTDIEPRLKNLTEDQQETTSIMKQEIEGHLNRIQILQKGLQSARTEHTSTISGLTKDLQDLQKSLQSARTEQTTTIGTLSEDIQDVQAKFQGQDADTTDLKAAMEKIQKDFTEIWDTFLRDMPRHYAAIVDLNDVVGLTHERLKGDRSPGQQADAGGQEDVGARARSVSMSLGQPSSPLRPPPSSQGTVSRLSTSTSEAPITMSQSTDDVGEESDPPVSSRGKRRRIPTKKSEESPMRVRKAGRTS